MWEDRITVYRGYRFRIYPDKKQTEQFQKIFSTVHFVYNSLRDAWISDHRIDFQCELSRLIKNEPWLGFINRSILNNAARQLEQACRKCEQNASAEKWSQGNSFTKERSKSKDHCVRDGGKGAESWNQKAMGETIPRRKCKHDAYSSFTLLSGNIILRFGKLYLNGQQGILPVRVAESRRIPDNASIISATISKNSAGHYFVSVLCRVVIQRAGNITQGRAIGLDYSLSHFFVSSDQGLKADECYLHRAKNYQKKLAFENHKLANMHYGSHNFEKQRKVIARLHEKIANQRNDYLQKLSTQIANEYDIVCVETLDLVEMEKKKHSYARKVSDNGWGEFVRMLDYKLKERGKVLVRVDKWYASSKICHECHYIYRDLKVSEREWICPVCGMKHDRDINASLNIRDEGLRILKNRKRVSRKRKEERVWNYGQWGQMENQTSYDLAEKMLPYSIGDDPESVQSEAENQMSNFWGFGPYGWEYRGCAWDSQFYVGMMEEDEEWRNYMEGKDDINGVLNSRSDNEKKNNIKDSGNCRKRFYITSDEDDPNREVGSSNYS